MSIANKAFEKNRILVESIRNPSSTIDPISKTIHTTKNIKEISWLLRQCKFKSQEELVKHSEYLQNQDEKLLGKLIKEELAKKDNKLFPKATQDDFQYAAQMEYLTLDEGIALLLSTDPKKVNWEKIKPILEKEKNPLFTSPFSIKYAELREIFIRVRTFEEK